MMQFWDLFVFLKIPQFRIFLLTEKRQVEEKDQINLILDLS